MPSVFSATASLGPFFGEVTPALSATSGSGCPSRFAGGQRSARCLPPSSRTRSGAASERAWAFRASQVAGFGHEVWAFHAAISERFTWLPASQRLKPQSSMSARFCTGPFASAAKRVCLSLHTQGRRSAMCVSPSKQERLGSHQPPNPSFKRTRLRRSA